jgi:hypothetical protein
LPINLKIGGMMKLSEWLLEQEGIVIDAPDWQGAGLHVIGTCENCRSWEENTNYQPRPWWGQCLKLDEPKGREHYCKDWEPKE